MRLDIRFLNQLPEGFLRQYPDLLALREADADHDGFIVEENNPAPQESIREASQFLRRIADGEGQPINPSYLPLQAQELMEEFQGLVDPLREVMETGRVSLEPLRRLSPQRLEETNARYLFEQVNRDFDNSIDRQEFRNAILGQRHPVIHWLRGAADEQYRVEQNHQHHMLPSIFHYASYIPRHLIHSENLYEGLSTMFRYMFGEGDGLRPDASSPYSWRGGMQEEVEHRHIRRLQAIDYFERIMGEHPGEGLDALLNRLRTDHPMDAEILTRDLRIHGWGAIETASTPQSRGRVAMALAQTYRNSEWNFNYGEGNAVGEFFSIPWRNNNFALAGSLYEILSDPNHGFPQDVRNSATAERRHMYGNGRSLMADLLPIDFDGDGPLWGLRLFGRWREEWSDEAVSFNTIWDESASFVLLLAATRGAHLGIQFLTRVLGRYAVLGLGAGLGGSLGYQACGNSDGTTRALCAGGGALGGLGLTYSLQSYFASRALVAAGTETAATATTEAATQSTWRTLMGYAGSGLRLAGRGLNGTLTVGTYGAMMMAGRHFLRPPNLTTDYHIDYSLRLSPIGDEAHPPATLTRGDLETLTLMNLVALHMNIQEERLRQEEEAIRVAEIHQLAP